jgi:hypothetical protein
LKISFLKRKKRRNKENTALSYVKNLSGWIFLQHIKKVKIRSAGLVVFPFGSLAGKGRWHGGRSTFHPGLRIGLR